MYSIEVLEFNSKNISILPCNDLPFPFVCFTNTIESLGEKEPIPEVSTSQLQCQRKPSPFSRPVQIMKILIKNNSWLFAAKLNVSLILWKYNVLIA
jgi:hypothetical protein